MARCNLTYDDELHLDEPSPSHSEEEGTTREHTFLESILLSMCDVDESNKKPKYEDKRRTKNRACAQESRAADRQYTHLLVIELEDVLKTFEMYATYIDLLKLHGACSAPDVTYCFEKCSSARRTNVAEVLSRESTTSPENLAANSTKARIERNRIHAQASRNRKNRFILDLTKERDVCLSTLTGVSAHTDILEMSCAVLSDFNDSGDAFMKLTQMRQGLLQRTRMHNENYVRLKSKAVYRVAFRIDFRDIMH